MMNTTRLGQPERAEPARPNWRHDAKCRGLDDLEVNRLFFPFPGEDPEPGKRFCADCPVKTDCLAFACEGKIPWGTLGGVTEQERLEMRKQLRNQRRQDQVRQAEPAPCLPQ